MMEEVMTTLKRYLDSERESDSLVRLPPDTYSKLAVYIQNLRRIGGTNGVELANRLIKKQEEILLGLTEQLLEVRLGKVMAGAAPTGLLPEERYVVSPHLDAKKNHSKFIRAISNGQPSFFSTAQKSVMSRKVTLRFLKPVGEIMGFDLKRYGPFGVHDLAVVPAGNAEILLSNGEAVIVDATA